MGYPISVLGKERILFLLVVNDLWEFASTAITPPTDAPLLAEHNKIDAEVIMPILNAARDHIIPHLSGKKTTNMGGFDETLSE